MTTRSHNVRTKNLSKNMLIGVVALLSLLGVAAQGASAQEIVEYTLGGIGIRSDVSATINLTVFINGPRCNGKVIFAVHGFAHTVATWGPFAQAVFEENLAGSKVCKIVALDLPGHGQSGLPTTSNGTVVFGNLTLEDYVTVLRNTLARLPGLELFPDTLLGHSQGGLLIQMTQQALKSIGTDLRHEFNIQHVVLMAPVPPQQISWAFTAVALTVLAPFVCPSESRTDCDPTLEPYVSIPDVAWPSVFFSNLSGAVVPGAPTSEEVATLGYNAPEPLFSAFELVGVSPRPSVDRGVFGPDSGTTLQVVTYEQDTIIHPSESTQLYEYLTGDSSPAGVAEVFGRNAVHDLHVSNPSLLLNRIEGAISLP